MHNVRTDRLAKTAAAVRDDPSAARLAVTLGGEWRTDPARPQFGGAVTFPMGGLTFEADFPAFLGGEGRAPTPLAYCFYGAMSCYGATFATQAALAGVEIRALQISLRLNVDFRAALGLGDYAPLDEFAFEVEVDTPAGDDAVQDVKRLADERCPAIWAMSNRVPYQTTARRIGE